LLLKLAEDILDILWAHQNGALATDNQGHDLGLKYFLNDSLVSNIVLDTSQVATDTIDYVFAFSPKSLASRSRCYRR
jgi:hypothetical protein